MGAIVYRSVLPRSATTVRPHIPARAVVLAIGALVVAGAVGVMNPSFVAGGNLLTIVATLVPVLIISAGVAVVVIAGEIDISVGAMYGTLAAMLGVLSSPTHLGCPWWVSVLAVLAAGGVLGAVNGVIVVWGRVPSIVATLAMMSVLRGVTQVILGGEWIKDLPPGVRVLGTGSIANIPTPIVVGGCVVAGVAWMLRHGRTGVRLYATGDNSAAAAYARVRTGPIRIGAFVFSGTLVGLAACFCVTQLAVVESGLGAGLELAVVTAVVVGGVSMSGGRGHVVGVAAAVLLLGLLPSIPTYLKLGEAAAHWERAFYGVCILAAVMGDRARTPASVTDLGDTGSRLHTPVLVGVLAGFMAVAWWVEPAFVVWGAQRDLLPDVAVVGLVSVSMTLVILTGGIDLSVGSAMALASVVAGMLTERGAPWMLAGAGAVATGTACGLFNGLVITRGRVHPLVATLATLALFAGVAEGVSRGRPLPAGGGFAPEWTSLGRATVGGVPVVLIPWVAAAGVAWVFLGRSVGGFRVRAVGVSERAARYAGLGADRVKVWVYTLSGASAGLAACLFIARRNTAKADVGAGIELEVITACVLGGVSLAGGRGGILGVVAAVLLLHEVRQFVAWRWQNDEVILFVLGGLLVASVVVSNVMRRRG